MRRSVSYYLGMFVGWAFAATVAWCLLWYFDAKHWILTGVLGSIVTLAVCLASVVYDFRPRSAMRSPGAPLLTFTECLLPPKSKLRQQINQSIADMRADVNEAQEQGQHRLARWIPIRDHFWIAVSIAKRIALLAFAEKLWSMFTSGK